MEALKVGHYTDQENGTGVSVFIFANGATGSYILSGSGPASHELATLEPETSVNAVHGLVLTGGSAFGLFSASGVMRYLAEHGIGLHLPHGVVPIVPAAGIYDLSYKHAVAPDENDAYAACRNASADNIASGRIGAGTGATVGKIILDGHSMTSGIGRAEMTLPNGVTVIAYAVVNAVGDVRGDQNQIIAGARKPNGEFANCEQSILQGHGEDEFFKTANTTLVAVFTDAKFTKSQLKRVAKMAIAGMARAITPIFTCFDGDICFAFSLGTKASSVMSVGTVAAEMVRQAIIDAVKDSEVVQ